MLQVLEEFVMFPVRDGNGQVMCVHCQALCLLLVMGGKGFCPGKDGSQSCNGLKLVVKQDCGQLRVWGSGIDPVI